MENKNIVNLLAPFVVKTFSPDQNAKNIISTYEALERMESGETIDYAELLDVAQMIAELSKLLKNYDDLSVEYTKLMNTVVPYPWFLRYRLFALTWFKVRTLFERECSDEERVVELIEEIGKRVMKNQNAFLSILYEGYKTEQNNLSCILSQNEDEKVGKISKEKIENVTQKLPVKLHGIRLYHGTSYENYLKIQEDGYIKASDYLDGDFPNENVAKIYRDESGYVFCSDDMDRPLAYGIGGFKENTLFRYFKSKDKKEQSNLKYHGSISVIFEIDTSKYETFYYRGKGQGEFLIKGNVSLDDVKVHMYKWDYYTGIIEKINEDFLVKEGIK